MRFQFKGKSGKIWNLQVKDRRIARIVKSCQDVPGQHLFQYLDDDGERHGVTSQDVNDYLREISGQDFSAKDFRTWAGTVLAAIALTEFESFDTKAAAKRNLQGRHRAGLIPARQYTGDLPQMLHPPPSTGLLSRR